MVSGNLPPMYMQIPTDHQLSLPAPNNFLTYQAPGSPSTGALFPYDNYFNHPPGIRSDEFDSDEDVSGEGSRKDGSLKSSTSSLGSFNNLAIDEKEESSSEYSDEKKKKPKPRRQMVENRRRASLHKIRSSSENIPPVSLPFPQVKRSTSSGTTASKSQQKVRTPSSPRSPSVSKLLLILLYYTYEQILTSFFLQCRLVVIIFQSQVTQATTPTNLIRDTSILDNSR